MRIKELDGLRGVSILLVAFFHYYSRWPDLYPYHNSFSEFPLFKYGSFGVELFFMISGLVIFMTLDKTSNFFIFVKKRWLRLFPSMLVVSLFVLFTFALFPHRPVGSPKFLNLIPGLTFLEPYWLTKITHLPFESLEGAFWSLYVEFRFYIIFGALYFILGRKKAIYGLNLILLAAFLTRFIQLPKLVDYFLQDVLLGRYLFWFIIGIYCYEYMKEGLNEFKIPGLIALILAFIYGLKFQTMEVLIVEFLCLLVFVLLIKSDSVKKVMGNKILLFFGTISYPLYLMHENAGVSLIIDVGNTMSFIPSILLPIIVLLPISLLAYIEVTYISPKLTNIFKKFLNI